MVLANLSLAVGLLLFVFVHPAGQVERNWLHAVCGFLLGVSIAVNLLNFWRSSRSGDTQPGKL
jgi:zinc transporter ZupT